MKTSRSIIGLILSFMAFLAYADSFEQYAVPVFSGPPAKPKFQSLPGSNVYRTRISDGIKQGANFAGHYAVVTFGCGTGCRASFLVDVKSGNIFDFPLGGEEYYMLSMDYRPDSKLIKASWTDWTDGDFNHPICVHEELVLEGTAFRLSRESKTKGGCGN
jgi:hypothetical protein